MPQLFSQQLTALKYSTNFLLPQDEDISEKDNIVQENVRNFEQDRQETNNPMTEMFYGQVSSNLDNCTKVNPD